MAIEQNLIEELPEKIFHPLVNLIYLDLGSNFIKNLPQDLLIKCIKLETFSIEYNSIEIIPEGAFRNNLNLKHINLSENKIKEVKDNFKNLKKIECVDLYNNPCYKQEMVTTEEYFSKDLKMNVNCFSIGYVKMQLMQSTNVIEQLCRHNDR